ncbi:hypothetical protein BD779DRAFT_1670121 [Infundibulicybe gibba]|nr:hypothetical protein BD779DRAFT_1670121 [Infundibulicybe gibba]
MLNVSTPERAGISRIPPEVLGEIFVHCLPEEDEGSASQGTQQLLSSICRLWRILVLATPALWASLDITCTYYFMCPPLPVIRTHLERSGTHPLSFILCASNSDYRDDPNLLPVLTALTTARQRWCNVHIKLNNMTQDIMDFITLGDAPLLQSMQCDVSFPSRGFPIPLRQLLVCSRLELFQWDMFESPFLLPLGETQLTSLSLRTKLSVSECITLLRLSPRLSSACFGLVDSSDSSSAPFLIHPTLRFLTTRGRHSETLLAALTLPALQGLDLTGELMLPPKWDIILSTFLERSRPEIHVLCLSMTHMKSLEPALLRILTLTPHLRSLRLSDCGSESGSASFTPALIRALHPLPPPGTALCPRLQMLYLCGVSCPDGLCGSMLHARWGAQAHTNGVACLEWARIEFEDGVHDRDLEDMEKLRAEGMEGEILE